MTFYKVIRSKQTGRKESFSLCLSAWRIYPPLEGLSIDVYLHLLSVKRLNKNISNNIFLFNLFYFWYLSGQPYNYLLCVSKVNYGTVK
jgi:hypothetical protein